MNKWMLLLSLFSAASYSASSDLPTVDILTPDYNPPKVSQQEQNNIICESVVCNSISQPQSVPDVGEVPERELNKTIETLASAIYIAGEWGVADNLTEPDDEHHVVE